MEHYYIGHIEIPSVLTKMETELSKSMRGYEYTIIAETEIDRVIQNLQKLQDEILEENGRLKRVDIKWAKFKYVSSNAGATIAIGRNQIQLIKINQFSGVFHEPDDPEGITSHELKHQMYGAKVQKALDAEKARKVVEDIFWKHTLYEGYDEDMFLEDVKKGMLED